MSELELLERAKRNDQYAFTEIFKRNNNIIFYMIYNMVNDTSVAEDLTIETFTKAFREIKNFVPNYKLISWITKIGKNKALDHIRRQSVRPRNVDLDCMMPERYHNIYTPEQEFIGKEQEKILETAISHLNGNYRKVTMLRMEGKKCKEIAQELNIPINTVVGYIGVSKKKMLAEQAKVGRIKIPKPETDVNQEILCISLAESKKLREEKTKKLEAARKQYLESHKEESKAWQKNYREKNREKFNEYHRNYEKEKQKKIKK